MPVFAYEDPGVWEATITGVAIFEASSPGGCGGGCETGATDEAAGGPGGGGYIQTSVNVTLGQNFTLTPGAAGAPTTGNGPSGGTTTVRDTATSGTLLSMTLDGGGGGESALNGGAGGLAGSLGLSGTSLVPSTDSIEPGGNGSASAGTGTSSASGAGGGSGAQGGAGADAAGTTPGAGGAQGTGSYAGATGGPGLTSAPPGPTHAGLPGDPLPGSAGGGARKAAADPAQFGGVAGGGFILITTPDLSLEGFELVLSSDATYVQVFPADPTRGKVWFCNTDAVQGIYISLGIPAAANSNVLLAPGGDRWSTAYQGPIYAIATGPGVILCGAGSPTVGPDATTGVGATVAASVSSTSSIIVPANAARSRVTITSITDTIIWMTEGTPAVVRSGIVLLAAGGRYISTDYAGAISAVHGLPGFFKNVCIQEETS